MDPGLQLLLDILDYVANQSSEKKSQLKEVAQLKFDVLRVA